jgi:signal recognition particle subunit SEC65
MHLLEFTIEIESLLTSCHQIDFWIVGADENDGGTFLVSNVNRNTVYKVLGVRNSLFCMVEPTFGQQPIHMKLTMVPWYGRLVYDGVIIPAHGRPGPPEIADDALAKKLKKSVKLARKEGRVVEKLAQLESPDAEASIPKAARNVEFERQQEEQAQKAPKTLEKKFLGKLQKLQVSDDAQTAWCMRRRGYTEHDNPNHSGVIISVGAGGLPLDDFTCSALAPNALSY